MVHGTHPSGLLHFPATAAQGIGCPSSTLELPPNRPSQQVSRARAHPRCVMNISPPDSLPRTLLTLATTQICFSNYISQWLFSFCIYQSFHAWWGESNSFKRVAFQMLVFSVLFFSFKHCLWNPHQERGDLLFHPCSLSFLPFHSHSFSSPHLPKMVKC